MLLTLNESLHHIIHSGKYKVIDLGVGSPEVVEVEVSRGRTLTLNKDQIKAHKGFRLLIGYTDDNPYQIIKQDASIVDIKLKRLMNKCKPSVDKPDTSGNIHWNTREIPVSVLGYLQDYLREKGLLSEDGILLYNYDVSIKLTSRNTIKQTNPEFTSVDIEDCFKEVKKRDSEGNVIESDTGELVLAYVHHIDLQTAVIIDLAELYDNNSMDLSEIIDLIKSTLVWRNDNRKTPADYIDSKNLRKQAMKSIEQHNTSSDMRVLARALDLQSDGKIKISRTDIIEELAMINNLLRNIQAFLDGPNSNRNDINQLRDELSSIYVDDSVDHVLDNGDSYIAIRGKLYLKVTNGVWLHIATAIRGRSLSLVYPEVTCDLLSADYSQAAMEDNFIKFISVNDLAQLY